MSSRQPSAALTGGAGTADEEDFELANASASDGGESGGGTPVPTYDSGDEAAEQKRLEAVNPALAAERARAIAKQREAKKARAEALAKIKADKAAEDKAFAADEASRRARRLEFLTQQAEIFKHFVPGSTAAAAAARSKKKKGGRHDGTNTEAAEDDALLADEGAAEGVGHRLEVQPGVITGTMRKYQIEGLNWLIHLFDHSMNGILADEMGLGKTLQTISLLGYLHEFRGITGPHLVIVPKSTLHNWINEFKKWCPVIRAVKFHGDKAARAEQKQTLLARGAFDVCVTSFEMVIKEKGVFLPVKWQYVIMDEAHRIKNEKSVLFQVVKRLDTAFRLLITGTPLQNNLRELWALLHFLLPEIFSSAETFEEWFSVSPDGGGDGDAKGEEGEVVSQLHKVLRPFLLRRLKADVEKGLPPKKETILKIGMSALQKKFYAALLQKDIDAIQGGADRTRLLNVVMQLRKCCNHPYLFQGAEPGPPYVTGDHLVDASGKMVLLDRLLPKLQARGSRVLIFSQMTRLLDILEDYCLFRQYAYCRIDGNTSGEDREAMIDAYNAENSDRFVFLLSTRAGGLGINLYTADTVVLYDSDWNPQMDLQAMDRAHRIGQKKEVQVFRFCTEHSIEEKVIEKAYKKLRLDALVIQQGRLTENTKTVNKEDLLAMVRYGAERVFSSDAASLTEEDIDAIIAKGEKATAELNAKMQQFAEGAMKFQLDGGLSLYEYKDGGGGGGGGQGEGGDDGAIDAQNLKAIMAGAWVDPPKRERKRVTSYSEDLYYRQALKAGGGGGGGGPKGAGGAGATKKIAEVSYPEHQFFDTARLEALADKEREYAEYVDRVEKTKANAIKEGASEETIKKAVGDVPVKEPLTAEDVAERARLQAAGFSTWGRKEFQAFVKASERYGRGDLAAIAREVETKTEADVKAYAAVFWERVGTLSDGEKIVKAIEKGEDRLARHAAITDALRAKLAKYDNPWNQLRVPGAGSAGGKARAFNEEADRFLLCMTDKVGWGAWEELKAAVRKCWRFRFDWFLKSRTPTELARRVEALVKLIEKEAEKEGAGGGGGGGGGSGGGGRGGSASRPTSSAGGGRGGSVGGDEDDGEAGPPSPKKVKPEVAA